MAARRGRGRAMSRRGAVPRAEPPTRVGSHRLGSRPTMRRRSPRSPPRTRSSTRRVSPLARCRSSISRPISTTSMPPWSGDTPPGEATASFRRTLPVARSVIPPGTAATRDFSGLAPRIPEFVSDACVGCMSCVSACPDSAILGIAQPDSVLEPAVAQFARPKPTRRWRRRARAEHFAHTTKYADVPSAQGPRAGPLRHLRRPGPLQGLR